MSRHRVRPYAARHAAAAVLLALSPVPLIASGPASATTGTGVDAVDEIHASFGNDPASSMVVGWRGDAASVDYGPDTTYGSSATPTRNAVTPVDIAGPFEHVTLTGLLAGTVYHYRIGGGADHEFETAPTGDFTWDDIGDTGTTVNTAGPDGSGCNASWMSQVWQQVADDRPDFVSHGGDISYANECGVSAVHQFFQDIAPIATMRAWEQAWGNHEYGSPNATSPPGTPRDSMANYKGRLFLPNPQTVPNDTATQVGNPGCPSPTDPSRNGCLGADWGYYQVGHVLIIEYPEPWYNAQQAWVAKADALMAQAETDPNVYFIVTTGHRPAYSASTSQISTDMTAAVNALGDKYSPAARPDGKYVLNIAHHVHGGEVFAPQHGVVQVTNGGGGTEVLSFGKLAAGEVFALSHFEHLHITVTGTSMKIDMVCGPVWPAAPTQSPCTAGSVVYSTVLHGTGPTPPPPPPPASHQWVTNTGLDAGNRTGWTGTYNSASKVGVTQAPGGNWMLQVSTSATASAPAGVNNPSPFWVNNASTAGTVYTATAQAQPGVAGEQVYLALRETTPSGAAVGYANGAVCTLTDTTALTALPAVSYQAHSSGNSIRYSVVVNNLSGSQRLYLDNLGLTSPA